MQVIDTTESSLDSSSVYSIPRAGRPFPAVVGHQGPRFATFVTQVSPFDVEDILGHDPRSRNHKLLRDARIRNLYDHVQRKTSEERVRDLLAYFRTRVFEGYPIAGAVPAISIAVEQAAKFAPAFSGAAIGNMFLASGRSNRRIVLDGLGRVTAVLDLVDAVTNEELEPDEIKELKAHLDTFTLPVVFYAPKDGESDFTLDEMQQIFADFNFRVRPVSAKDAIALDHCDPYVELTRYLASSCSAIAKNGGMETKAASLGKKSTAIVVQPVLLRFVRGAVEGESYLEASRNTSIADPKLTAHRSEEIRANLSEFLDAFAEAMGEKWADRQSMHLSSPGWQVIALLYHDCAFRLGKGLGDQKKFAAAIARLDWDRGGELFEPFMSVKAGKDGETHLALNSAGASVRRELLKNCRAKLGLDDLLAELD